MASSAFYSLWLHDGTQWHRVPNHTGLSFNRAMNMIGGMTATVYTKNPALKDLMAVAGTPYRIMTAASTNGLAYNEVGGVANSFIVQQGTLAAPSADQKTETATDGPITWKITGHEIAELVTKMTFDNTITTTDDNGTTQLAQPLSGTVGNIIKRSDNNQNFGIIDNLNGTLQGRPGTTIITPGTIEAGPSVSVKFRQDKAYQMLLDLAALGSDAPNTVGVAMSSCSGLNSDVTGNGRNLTLNGSPTTRSSPWPKYGNGINLDGVDDSAITTNSYFNHIGDMTYFFAGTIDALPPGGGGADGWWLGGWTSAANFSGTYLLWVNSSGGVVFSTAGTSVVSTPNGTVAPGDNIRVWVTRNSSTKTCVLKVYKNDGSAVQVTGTYTGSPSFNNDGDARFLIGQDNYLGSVGFNDGAVYEARFWKTVVPQGTLELIADPSVQEYYGRLTGTEGAAWFMCGDSAPVPTLLGSSIVSGSGLTSDVSGNGRHLTASGTPASRSSTLAKYDLGLNMDGVDDDLYTADSVFNTVGDFSVFWAGTIDVLSTGWVFFGWNSPPNYTLNYFLSAHANGEVAFHTASQVNVILMPAGSVSNGETIRLWATRNATTKQVALKIFKENGNVLYSTGTYTGNPAQDLGVGARLNICHDTHTGGGSADVHNDGAVYEARFWTSLVDTSKLDAIANPYTDDYKARLEGTEQGAWVMSGETGSLAERFPNYILIDAEPTGSAPSIKYLPRVNYVGAYSATYVQPNGLTGFRTSDPVTFTDTTRSISELRQTRAVSIVQEQDRIKNAINVKYAGGGSTNSTGNSGQLQTGFAVETSSVARFNRQELTVTAPWIQNNATATLLRSTLLSTYDGLPNGIERVEITMRRAAMYNPSGFNANLGDVVGLVRKNGAHVTGRFLSFRYTQDEERLTVILGLPDPNDGTVPLTDYAATARMNQHSIGSLERVAFRDNRQPTVLQGGFFGISGGGFGISLGASSSSNTLTTSISGAPAGSANAAGYLVRGRIYVLGLSGGTPPKFQTSPTTIPSVGQATEYPVSVNLKVELGSSGTYVTVFDQTIPGPIPSNQGGSIPGIKFEAHYPFAVTTTTNAAVDSMRVTVERPDSGIYWELGSGNGPQAEFIVNDFQITPVPKQDYSHVHNQ